VAAYFLFGGIGATFLDMNNGLFAMAYCVFATFLRLARLFFAYQRLTAATPGYASGADKIGTTVAVERAFDTYICFAL